MDLALLQSRLDRSDGFYQALRSRENGLIQEVKDLKGELDILAKASAVIKHLLDVFVKDEINKMAGLVTYGLKTVFDNQNLTFNPVISRKNDKVFIELKTSNNGIEGEFGSFGGSVAVIESFLLRVICILRMKLARVLLLDETFAAIGDEYIPNTTRLVEELSKKLGLDVLLVTQQMEFKNHAGKVYRLKDSPSGLKIEREK